MHTLDHGPTLPMFSVGLPSPAKPLWKHPHQQAQSTSPMRFQMKSGWKVTSAGEQEGMEFRLWGILVPVASTDRPTKSKVVPGKAICHSSLSWPYRPNTLRIAFRSLTFISKVRNLAETLNATHTALLHLGRYHLGRVMDHGKNIYHPWSLST